MPTLEPNQLLFNKYRIERALGEGAFGAVYLVTHLKLNVYRAIKILHHDAPLVGSTLFGQARQRFDLESQLGARLDHPNIIRVYDFEEAEGSLILVMEFAPGGSLADRENKYLHESKVFSLEEVLKICIEISQGLAALHAIDVVHRDLKPSNILFDDHGHAKIADLGLAQVLHGFSMRPELGSLAPRHPGTPEYMSPEQDMSTEILGPSSDVYTLGKIFFELLTGRHVKMQRPGTKVSTLRKDTPLWLDDLVTRMLDKDPEKRPWDGSEMVELLKDGQASEYQAIKDAIIQAQRTAEAKADELARMKAAEDQARIEAELQAQRAVKAKAEADERARIKAAEEQARQEAELQAQRAAKAKAKADELARIKAAEEQAQRATQAKAKAEAETRARRAFVQERKVSYKEIIVTLAPGVEMSLLRIPAGEFLMGSSDKDSQASGAEKPQHKLHLAEYWIGKTPVTNAQYQAFIQCEGQKPPQDWLNGKFPDGKAGHPVVNVNWHDGSAFCEWLSQLTGKDYRLPSEAQWEKAARGTDGCIYPWGDRAPDEKLCNFGYKFQGTTAVGRFYPRGNSLSGCQDMSGNVWEWTSSLFKDYPYQAQDGREDSKAGGARVLRGGAFHNYHCDMRSAFRHYSDPAPFNYNASYGFRCSRLP